MALINIEYGSLASSETMNKNFIYLEDKIAESTDSLMTSISSILSNIATINARISDLAEGTGDSLEELKTKLDEYKAKTKILVNKASMLPNWKGAYSVEINAEETYTVPSNGYLLLLPTSAAKGNLMVNDTTVVFKARGNSYDNAAQLVVVPVSENDLVTSDVAFANVYFMPVAEVGIEDF